MSDHGRSEPRGALSPNEEHEYRGAMEQDSELLEIAAALDEAGRRGRDDRRAALEQPATPEDLAVTRDVFRRYSPDNTRSTRRPMAMLFALTAASIVLTVFAMSRNTQPEPTSAPPSTSLGATGGELVTEIDALGYRAFRWSVEKDPNEYYVVEVFATGPDGRASTDDHGGLLLRSGELQTSSWTPTDEQAAELSKHNAIVWDLLVYGAGLLPQESYSCAAAR